MMQIPTKTFIPLAVLSLVVAVASCAPTGGGRGGGGAGPIFFHSPLEKPVGVPADLPPSALFSNLGEKRSGDGPAWTNHGATDFKTSGRLPVYSPDTGKVRFYGAQVQGHTARNAGLPPIKIGRFSMLHFASVAQLKVDPRQIYSRLQRRFGLPPAARNWPVYVVKSTDTILISATGATTTLGSEEARPGVRRAGLGQFENVFYFNQEFKIAQTHGPDLHVIYYDTKASDYGDRSDIRNALSVFKYKNPTVPKFDGLWLFSQNLRQGQAKKLITGNSPARNSGNLDIRRDGGVDVVVRVSSFQTSASNRAGIYKLAYSVDRFLSKAELEDPPEGAIGGPGGRQMVPIIPMTTMYTYSRMPRPAQDENLVASRPKFAVRGATSRQLSIFAGVNTRKRTAYAVTNTDGDDAKNWGLHQVRTFPDGEYLLTVKAWNIKQAGGIGVAPTLGDASLQRIVGVRTRGNNRRLRISSP